MKSDQKGINKWMILAIVVSSTFMATLDSSIVNVALPTMARSLGVETSAIQFVASSYLIVITATVLLFGRLGDRLGRVQVFNLGIALFTLGSLMCGSWHSFDLLIFSRIVQAIGASAMMANNQGIITEFFPANERGRALGLAGTTVALGSLTGPGLGGIIVGHFDWTLIFLINVPIGIFAAYAAYKWLPKSHVAPGTPESGNGAGRGLERNPLSIFKNWLFSISVFCAFITFIAMFCNSITLPFYLQEYRGFEPQQVGLVMMFYPLILAFVAPASGYLSDRIGSESLTFAGQSCLCIGLVGMAYLGSDAPVWHVLSWIAIMAVGMGLFQSPNTSLIMATAGRERLGLAGSINAFVRNLGMVAGIALATFVLYGLMGMKLETPVTSIRPGEGEAFLFGMRGVYLTAATISAIGVIITFVRLIMNRRHTV